MEFQLYTKRGLVAFISPVSKSIKKNAGRLLLLTGLVLVYLLGTSQTTPLTFSQIPVSNPDFTYTPGRGANQWNFQNTVNIPNPATNSNRSDAYYRFTWLNIQPANGSNGVYDWTFFDSQIQQAIDAGQKFSFGIMQQCGGCDASQQSNIAGGVLVYPTWLHNKMQSESPQDYQTGQEWFPNYNSASWLAAWKALNIAVNNHIMTTTYKGIRYQDVIFEVDVRGYGDFGEWTENDFSGPGGTQATAATLNTIIDATVQSYPTFQCVVLQATFDGQQLGNTNIPPATGYYALTTSNAHGLLGWRRDSWGWTDNYNDQWTDQNPTVFNGMRFDTAIMNRYKVAPILGEPADGGQAGQFGALPGQMTQFHVNSFGNGNLNVEAGDGTTANNFRAASKAAGYHLILTGGSMTTTLATGSPFNLSINWQNIGAAPTYENWNVVYELRNASNTVVWSGTSTFNPRLFSPAGASTVISDNFTLPASVPQGTYSMFMIIRDPKAFRQPLPLSITGRNADGSYLLRSNITVGTGTGNSPPVANAGANQVVQLPTATASLTGSGTDASGTITTYAWSKVSGPAGGTIATPSSANTNITGLVQGVYVFSLKLTDNLGDTGSATVQVTVNPAIVNSPPVANAGANQVIQLPTSTISLTGSGTDASGTITSYVWSEVSGPAGATISTPGTASTNVTGLAQGVYIFRLLETDNLSDTGSATVQVTVNPPIVNSPPVANAGANQVIQLPTSTVSLTGSGTDASGTITSYTWTQVSGPAGATISAPATASTNVTGLVQGVYLFRLTEKDNLNDTGSATTLVTVNPAVLPPPIANAGGDPTITLPTNSITLDGSSSSDPGGTITSYLWTKISGPAQFTIGNSSSAITLVSNLTAGLYSFQLKVTDNRGDTSLATVEVTVNPAIVVLPPVANAGVDQTITLPTNSVTLNGSGSSDPSGTITGYQWNKITGPAQFTIANSVSVSTSVSNLVAGVYSFQLIVTDNNGAIAQDTVKVIVNPAPLSPPVANAGADITITLPINTASLNGSASSDPSGTITSYTWSQVSGPAAATIAAPNSVTTSINGLLQGNYIFGLKVIDNNGLSNTDTVLITVNPAPNLPPVANAGTSKSITLPVNSTNLDGSLSTDPDGTVTAYSWIQISGPSSSIINGSAAAVATATNLVAGLYTFQLTVTDNQGATGTATVKITVISATVQPPIANAGANQTITLPTNSVTINGSASSASSGLSIVSYVWIESSGPTTLSLSNTAVNTLNNLLVGVYVFTLTVTDNNGATGTNTVTITVNPAPNQPPVANAGASISLTLPVNSTILDGTKSYDPDGSISAYNWTQISGPNSPTITGANTATLNLSGLIAGQYIYQLTVTDNLGAISSAQVKVIVSPATNQPPVANAGPNQSITAPANTVTLDGSASYDPDGTITAYSWVTVSGPGSVTISNSNTATPTVTGLQTGVYIFELTVTDNGGATSKNQVTVIVDPKPVLPNQAPVANAGTNQTITEPTNSIILNGTSSFDPDGTIANYSWIQISGPSASVISGGNTATPTVSQLIVGQYVYQLTVTDNNGATNTDQVTITVNPAIGKLIVPPPVANAGLNDTIILPTNSYMLDASASTDPGGTITDYQWQQVSGPNTASATSMSGAQVSLSNLAEGTYVFEVTVTDNNGASSVASMTLKVESSVSINDRLVVFPNPAHEVIHLKISSSVMGSAKVYVYDVSGKLVAVTEVEKSNNVVYKILDVSSLAPGMYTVLINIANMKTMVTKFIKY